MDRRDEYLKLISNRGDLRGKNGGLLDLLDWCGKLGLCQVTEAEAKRFWEDPCAAYSTLDCANKKGYPNKTKDDCV